MIYRLICWILHCQDKTIFASKQFSRTKRNDRERKTKKPHNSSRRLQKILFIQTKKSPRLWSFPEKSRESVQESKRVQKIGGEFCEQLRKTIQLVSSSNSPHTVLHVLPLHLFPQTFLLPLVISGLQIFYNILSHFSLLKQTFRKISPGFQFFMDLTSFYFPLGHFGGGSLKETKLFRRQNRESSLRSKSLYLQNL